MTQNIQSTDDRYLCEKHFDELIRHAGSEYGVFEPKVNQPLPRKCWCKQKATRCARLYRKDFPSPPDEVLETFHVEQDEEPGICLLDLLIILLWVVLVAAYGYFSN